MRRLLCPLAGRHRFHIGGVDRVNYAISAALGLLMACLLVVIGGYLWAVQRNLLELDALAGVESAMQGVGPLAPLIVEVDARGWAFAAGRRVTPPALRELLRRAVRLLPNQQVIFKVNESTHLECLGPFLDACTAAGIRQVYFQETH